MSKDIDLVASMAPIFLEDWRGFAACADMAPPLFENPDFAEDGKRVCATCAVRVECLDSAMFHEEGGDTLRGGMTDKQRVSLYSHRSRYAPQFKAEVELAISSLNETTQVQ